MRDRRLLAVLGAGAIAVVAIVVIVVVGLAPIPEFDELDGSGESGYVAYVPDGEEPPRSARVVDLSAGQTTDVRFGHDGEAVGWDDDGNLVVVQWGPTVRMKHVDPATGEQVGELEDVDDFRGPEGRDDVWVEYLDGRVVLQRDDGMSASFDAPESYDVTSASSMGEDRVVFVDELGRVAVCDVGEGVTPVLVADDAQPWNWVTARP
jgi:hypothetical protein